VSGPRLRTDIIDVYTVRAPHADADPTELLQIRRTRNPAAGTWQPVMGHVEPGERAIDTLWRELVEEIGLDRTGAVRAWSLERVRPFFLAERDEIVCSPRFVVEAARGWEPTLNDEHDAARWAPLADAERWFMWPGQREAIAEIRGLFEPGSLSEPVLRIV